MKDRRSVYEAGQLAGHNVAPCCGASRPFYPAIPLLYDSKTPVFSQIAPRITRLTPHQPALTRLNPHKKYKKYKKISYLPPIRQQGHFGSVERGVPPLLTFSDLCSPLKNFFCFAAHPASLVPVRKDLSRFVRLCPGLSDI
jgi:hypothetical protein